MAITSAASRWIYAVSFALGAAGYLAAMWPLSILALLLASLSGRWIFALLMGLLFDLAWGSAFGIWAYVYFPFTAVALLGAVARYYGSSYFLERGTPDTL